jgi:peroxiredoxin Q/BCP
MTGLLRRLYRRLTAPKLLEVGSAAPPFRVTAHDGSVVTLEGLRGRRVVLWFFPEADTPGCTLQGRGLCADYERFAGRGVTILGASFDDQAANRAFAAKFAFPFPLLCDTDRSLGLAYRACSSAADANARRITYVIDEEGIIRHALARVDPASHAADVWNLLD